MLNNILHNFQLAQIWWLWGLIAVPLIWGIYALLYRQASTATEKLKDFADPHLLPHLLGEEENQERKNRKVWFSLLVWSLLWSFGILAMAGPRWDYTEVKAFAPARNLVILLDLSRSMDAQDVKPSRLARARQEIEDMNKAAQGMNIGLIAFASVPHVLTPLTDERETLARLLPSLKTNLVYTQGSALSPALLRAGEMLASEPGTEKHILVITDGEFQDGDAAIFKAEQALKKKGVNINVMGIGTAEGAPVPDGQGGFSKENGKIAISRLETDNLKRIAQDGNGLYLTANYLGNDTQVLLNLMKNAVGDKARKTTRFWEERFYLLLIPFALIALPWFRRHAAFPALIIACLLWQPSSAQAFEWRDLFLNKQQQGAAALEKKQYKQAAQKFDDPYNRGVAEYKAGQYEQAAQAFAAANKANAGYNLGNAQLMNGKIEDAITSYENVLKANPNHEDVAHNLKIAKKMLEQQKQRQKQDQQKDQKQNQKQDGKKSDQDQKSDQQNNDQQGSQKKQQQSGNQKNQSEKKSETEQKKDEEQQQAQSGEESKDQQKPQDLDKQQKPSGNANKQQQQDGQPTQQQQAQKTQQDIDADQWLNRIQSDPDQFLRNKFYIESQRQGAKQGENPW